MTPEQRARIRIQEHGMSGANASGAHMDSPGGTLAALLCSTVATCVLLAVFPPLAWFTGACILYWAGKFFISLFTWKRYISGETPFDFEIEEFRHYDHRTKQRRGK